MTKTLLETIKEDIEKLDKEKLVTDEEKDQMALALSDFITATILKFLAGQKEHGGRLINRNCLAEARKELQDLFWYLEFETIKKQYQTLAPF